MYTNILNNSKGGAGTKAILGIFISLALIVVIVGGVFGYFWNATPDKIGFADAEIINGQSLRELGLADTKLKDIYKQFRQLAKPNDAEIVKNQPTEEDKTATEDNFDEVEGDALTPEGATEPDYSLLITTELTYPARTQQVWKDTSLAYVFNQIVKGSVDNAAAGGEEGVEFLKEINASIEELSITRIVGEDGKLRIVFSVDTSSFQNEIKEQLGALAGLISIPEKIYIVSYFTLSADTENSAKISATSEDLKINDTENALSQALFKVLASQAGGESDMTEDEGKAFVNDKIGDAFQAIVYNMGDLGVIADEVETLGDAAIVNGQITILTRTA